METAEKVIEVITKQAMLEPGDITIETKIEDLGIDSITLIETIFALEEAFDISIPFNANDPSAQEFDLTTVGAIVKEIDILIAQRGA